VNNLFENFVLLGRRLQGFSVTQKSRGLWGFKFCSQCRFVQSDRESESAQTNDPKRAPTNGPTTTQKRPHCTAHCTMENTFITDAIDLVSRAIAADNENEYEKALALYRDALARFTMGLKYEKNEARKKLILERVVRFSIRKILDLGGLTCLYSNDHTVPRLGHFC
jgi:hypothetical protein